MLVQNERTISADFYFEEGLKQELKECRMESFDKGDVVIKQSSYIKNLPLLLKGNLRVYSQTEDREILFYYIEKGKTCGLSLAACLENKQVHSEVTALHPSDVLLIPSRKVQDWSRKYPSWNHFIISTLSEGQQQLLETCEELAFCKMETRINDHLKHLSQTVHSRLLPITHQQLANELGTTRVVISRILKSMESKGSIVLQRGHIQLKTLF